MYNGEFWKPLGVDEGQYEFLLKCADVQKVEIARMGRLDFMVLAQLGLTQIIWNLGDDHGFCKITPIGRIVLDYERLQESADRSPRR